MKRTLLIFGTILLSMLMTSCWEFNRQQKNEGCWSNGKATLLEVENSKKAMIETAKAENESATLLNSI